MANPNKKALRLIGEMEEPRSINPLPEWLSPGLAEQLINDEFIVVLDPIRGESGELIILNGVELTTKGMDAAYPKTNWQMVSAIISGASILVGVALYIVKKLK